MVKKKIVRRHVIKHHSTPKKNQGVLPSAYASHQPTAPGQFNPPGWDKQHDYGVQGTSPFTQGPPTVAADPSVSVKGFQQGPPGSTQTHPGPGTPPPAVTKRVHKSVWYATGPDGQTWKGEGKLSMQARQYYAEHGVKVTSRPPAQAHQQGLSDKFGITTFTKWGDVSTTQQNPFKQRQQGLSDQYGITTYNLDGSVSTKPNVSTAVHTSQQNNPGPWWARGPDTVSAEGEDKKKTEKPFWQWW